MHENGGGPTTMEMTSGLQPRTDWQAHLLLTLQRFAFPVAASVIGTLVLLSLVSTDWWHQAHAAGPPWPVKIVWGAVAAFLASFAACLFADHRGTPTARRTLYSGLAFATSFAVCGVLADAISLSPPMLVGGLALLLCVTEVPRQNSSENSFWNFNHNLWVGAAVALIAAGLFSAGVITILSTSNFLLKTNVQSDVHSKVILIAFGVVGPVSWLVQQAALGNAAAEYADEGTFLSRAVGAIVKFLLVPLLLAYAVILHIYGGKIGVSGVLPKGQLGWIVLTFGSFLIITALAAFKTRESGGALVRGFWRAWPWLLAVPTVLLFLGILARTHEYGITESRYLVLLAGVWLVLVVLTQGVFGFLGRRRDIRLIPAIISGLLILASFGPWGAVGWSDRWQYNDLVKRLTASGLVEGGKVVASTTSAKGLVEPDKARVHGIVDYYRNRYRLDQLKPLFAGRADDPFAMASANNWNRAQTIKHRLGIAADYHGPDRSRGYRNYSANEPTVLRKGELRIVNSIQLNQVRNSKIIADTGGTISASLEGGVVTIIDAATKKMARFDLINHPAVKARTVAEPHASNGVPLIVKSSGELEGDLVLTSFHSFRVPNTTITDVSFWLVIGGGK
jgi:hypothetical protein